MKTNLNLVPAEFHRRLIVRNGLFIWSGVGVLVCAALLALGYRQHSKLTAVRDEVQTTEARCRPVREMERENETLSRRIGELHSRQTLLSRLNRGRHPLQLVGLVSRSAFSTAGELKVTSFSYEIHEAPPVKQETPVENAAVTEAPDPVETIRLKLDGMAANDLAVAKFIAAMRDSGYFASVELKSSMRAREGAGRARKFVVDCTL